MTESLSVSNCTLGKDLSVHEHPIVDKKIQMLYGNFRTKIARLGRIYFHTSSSLCTSDKFKLFMKGKYKRTKGCYNNDKEKIMRFRNEELHKEMITRRTQPIHHTNYATLHPNHIRCDNKNAVKACFAASKEPISVPDELRRYNAMPFVVRTSKVVVGKSGMLAMDCGPFGLFASCEAVKCGLSQLIERQMPVCISR